MVLKLKSNPPLTERQVEVLAAAHKASDGWIMRGFSRIWGIAPTAITACVRKGLLEMPHGRGRARLTDKGRQTIEALIKDDPARFGLTEKTP
jgi:hypothetical protein